MTALSLVACHAPTENYSVEEKWQIKYQVSGGIAGMMQGLIIQHDGQYRVYDKKRGIEKKLTATEDKLLRLAEQLRQISNHRPSPKKDTSFRKRCADCITRHIQIDYKNSKFHHKSGHSYPNRPEYHVLSEELHEMLNAGLGTSTEQDARH